MFLPCNLFCFFFCFVCFLVLPFVSHIYYLGSRHENFKSSATYEYVISAIKPFILGLSYCFDIRLFSDLKNVSSAVADQ